MADSDDSVVARNGAALTPLAIACASFAVLLFAACKPKPPDGIYVDCHSNHANTYWKWSPNACTLPGGQVTGCYEEVYAEHLTYCYGKDEWLTSDTGDDETGVSKGIDPANWPNDDPSLDYIRTNCTSKCIYWHDEKSGKPYVCDAKNWIMMGYNEVLATALKDPSALHCRVDFGKQSHFLMSRDVLQAEGPVSWPSDNSTITLACSTYQSCTALFDEDIMSHLAHDGTAPLGDDEGEADYLVTSSTMSSSTLTLGIANGDLPSEDSNWVEGYVEYTALDCGQSTCPLYLGNLRITNTGDSWDLYSELEEEDITVSNIHIQLRSPTLGVWRPSTGEIYFDSQALDLNVDFDLGIDAEPTSTVTRQVTNDDGLFGIRHVNNEIELSKISMSDDGLTGSATLNFDSVDGSPPVASFMLPSTVVLDPNAPGLVVSSILEQSTDPDNDLDFKLWLIDGQQVGPNYVIPAGLHTIRLEVRDSRLAFDYREQLVMVTYGKED